MAAQTDVNIYRLVYLSENRIAGNKDCVQHEIDQILAISRRHNKQAEITGALMFNRGCFAQILEGAYAELQETFERIQCDSRHANVVVLKLEAVEHRQFADWAMAYVGEDAQAVEAFERFRMNSDLASERLLGDQIFDLLKQHLIHEEKYSLSRD